MAPLNVHIKHAGKVHDITLDPDLPPAAFKDAIYQVTGVPPDRVKVMVKGGVLKDDSSWKKIGPKEGQTFMVIGAAGELPKAPTQPIKWLEDMDDSELAEALAKPVGLTNLGNTCYMNATIQSLRAIPELQIALSAPSLQSSTPLPGALRDLYSNMSKTTDTITPMKFLTVLREVNPQFAEMDRRESKAMDSMLGRGGYAQQDADECYGTIITNLRNVPGLDGSGNSLSSGPEAAVGRKRFIEQFMMGELRREITCDEAPEEPPTVSTEQVLKIECNINITTNFMLSGIMNSFESKLEKNSPTLGRNAIYTMKARMSRLPTYLTVHMVRFAWREDIGKKAKIMRKVKFPLEFDALDLATEDLRAKLVPANRKLKDIEKDRGERRKVRKRTKAAVPVPASSGPTSSGPAPAVAPVVDVQMGDDVGMTASEPVTREEPGAAPGVQTGVNTGVNTEVKMETEVQDFEDEVGARKREAQELRALIPEDVMSDVGASATGLYDLVAIVTHKGAAADAGHYMGFVKKSVLDAYRSNKLGDASSSSSLSSSAEPGRTTAEIDAAEGDEDWYKFDDDKVSVFPKEKLATLDGGGEDSSAYVLLYRSKPIA